jgi:hypothetical protein
VKRALLIAIHYLAALTFLASIGYMLWFDRHTSREHTRPDEVSFLSKGKTHWATPEEMRRDAWIRVGGLGGSMVVMLTIIIYTSTYRNETSAKDVSKPSSR